MNTLNSFLLPLVSVLLVSSQVFASEDRTASKLGISKQKPDSGPIASRGDDFLVSYDERLPGTEVTMAMVPIPGGEFLMGSPSDEPGREENEGPQRKIKLEAFWMAQYEVTWEQYQRFMAYYDIFKERSDPVSEESQADAVTCPTPLYDPTFTYALGEEPQQPAVTMSQYAAKQFTKWLSKATGRSYRLPTEAEWEYACRAGTTTRFSCGDEDSDLEDYAWYYDNSDDMYQEVGQKKPNAWGLYDMHGNVAEYVLDGLATYEEAESDDSIKASEAIFWPKELFGRVVRGGSWESDPEDLRSASRAADDDWRIEDPNLPKSPWWFTDEQGLCVGFRVVRQFDPISPQAVKQVWDADVEEIFEDVDFRVSEGRGVFGLLTDEDSVNKPKD